MNFSTNLNKLLIYFSISMLLRSTMYYRVYTVKYVKYINATNHKSKQNNSINLI